MYEWFLAKLKNRQGLASLVTCLVVVFAIIIPIAIFVLVLVQQLVDLYFYVSGVIKDVHVEELMGWKPGGFFYDLSGTYRDEVSSLVLSNIESLKSALTESARTISTFAASQSAKLLASLGLLIFDFTLMLFTLYFFYKDGRRIVERLMSLSPIPVEHEKAVLKKFREISSATLFGTFLTAGAQGIVAWIGFSLAGVHNAFFWGAAVSVASLIPVVGTTLVTLPVSLGVIISGSFGWGIFLAIWGLAVVTTVDNLVRIIFIGSTINLNPLLTFLAVFGGITAFGLPGVIIGPMVLVLFLTFLHIYESEYHAMLVDLTEKDTIPLAESSVLDTEKK
jgi:predicted PurR-regulated permease PerM